MTKEKLTKLKWALVQASELYEFMEEHSITGMYDMEDIVDGLLDVLDMEWTGVGSLKLNLELGRE